MGMTLQYLASVKFPKINTIFNLNAQPVAANQPINGGQMYSDETGMNYRKIAFVSTAGVTTELALEGITNFKQTKKETITLNGDTPVLTESGYTSFTVIPAADIDTLSIGNDKGTTDFIGNDGTPSTHRIVKRGSGALEYTIYGLNTFASMSETELALQRYTLDAGLNNQTGSTTSAVYVPKGGCRYYMDVTSLADDGELEWWVSTQSII